MSEEYVDPSGNTEQFKAFVQHTDAVPEKPPSRLLLIGLVAVIVVAVAVVVSLAL